MSGKWVEMLHGQVNAAEQQTKPCGRNKLYNVNRLTLMVRGQRLMASGLLQLCSASTSTITGRYFPALFQQGETACRKAIVDGQHPHHPLMELKAINDVHLDEKELAAFHVSPVRDPSLGPVAFPHRISSESDPLAPLAHQLQDSTHIFYDVVTGGLSWGGAQLEASGFRWRESRENRWTIGGGAADSRSAGSTASPQVET